MEKQKIVIRRSFDWIGFLRKLSVYVDEKRIGCINVGQTKAFDLKEGKHSIIIKVDYDIVVSNIEEFVLEEGQTINMYVKVRRKDLFNAKSKNFLRLLDLEILLGVEPLINKK
jgi:hypothetical protein